MAQRHLTVQRSVAASPDSVWELIADFPDLADHWDGLRGSERIGDRARGVGARRRVELKPMGTLIETVTAWEEGRLIATRNEPSALVPFSSAESEIRLEPDDAGTTITFEYRYVPRGGPVGALTGPVIDVMLRQSFEDMLEAIGDAAHDGD